MSMSVSAHGRNFLVEIAAVLCNERFCADPKNEDSPFDSAFLADLRSRSKVSVVIIVTEFLPGALPFRRLLSFGRMGLITWQSASLHRPKHGE